MSTFEFDASSFDYEALAKDSELKNEKGSAKFASDKQTAFHVIPLSKKSVGVELYQYNQQSLTDVCFGRTVLSLMSTDKINPFLGQTLVDKGYKNYKMVDGKPVFNADPVEEIIAKLKILNPVFNGKQNAPTRKCVTYYLIVPYATRTTPTKQKPNPEWEEATTVRAFWLLGKDGNNKAPGTRKLIENAIRDSNGQVCNLNSNTYLAISRTGTKMDDTKYESEIIENPTFKRPSVAEVFNTIKLQWNDMQLLEALDFMIPTFSEVELLAEKNKIVLTSLYPDTEGVKVEDTSSTTTTSIPDNGLFD